MRFYPLFDGLKLSNVFTHPAVTKIFMLGIALNLLATVANRHRNGQRRGDWFGKCKCDVYGLCR